MAVLAKGPSASSSRTRSASPSSIETSSPARSVSPIQNSDSPPSMYTSSGKTKGHKSVPRREQILASGNPQRTSLGMAEQRLLKPVASRTTAMHQLSVSAPKLLTDATRLDKQSRSHQSHTKSVPIYRKSATTKPTVAPRTTHSDMASTGSKRSGSPSPLGIASAPKARKVSHASDAASSSRTPVPDALPGSDSDSVATAELLAAFAPRRPTQCKTCQRALEPQDGWYKNCLQCREKSREYQRRYLQGRKERKESRLSLLDTAPGTSTSAGASASRQKARASSPEHDAMEVDLPMPVPIPQPKPKPRPRRLPPAALTRRVWDEVPEFQTEDDFFEAIERSVSAWRESMDGSGVRFEFGGGYAVVAGGKEAEAAATRKVYGKLVLRGVPMSRHSCFTRPTSGGPAPADGSYHVYNSLSTVYHCTCRDSQDTEGPSYHKSSAKENVCRGRVKIIVETTNEMNDFGAFGINVVVETWHAL
ncbi:uncharacterized protein C8Q71DRAFT_854219 [Rhodofomes roseus]|uniref:Uncharacterized protein n=1 Tax=Rhodofomes roseus TaxID=34475 RepID=A0ABQ8KTI3_9APHY|nr:uncharacterized protein C8Q71DRAFT_854219 [Rhodofomes roseus]KAH9841864.1 hypothetical protein C8Q71DRAFT_854219 [Rhodofomes roseus]